MTMTWGDFSTFGNYEILITFYCWFEVNWKYFSHEIKSSVQHVLIRCEQTQLTFTHSKSTIETFEKGVKYVIKTPTRRQVNVSWVCAICSEFIHIKCQFLGLRQYLIIESNLKMMEKPFYFILKALFICEIITFLSWLFGHVEKRLDRKAMVNFKICYITDWITNNFRIR